MKKESTILYDSRIKHYLFLIALFFLMYLPLLPSISLTPVLAADTHPVEAGNGNALPGFIEQIYVNPIYSDIIDESSLFFEEEVHAASEAVSCSSMEEAAVIIRSHLLNRDAYIRLSCSD